MPDNYTKPGADYGFYLDQTLCTGCKACQIACVDKHDLPLGVCGGSAHRGILTGSASRPVVVLRHQI